MKLLFTGKGGKSGSWQIRAREVGEALGATVKAHSTLEECQAADVIVVVKRITPQLLANIRASGRPWVFDTVDFFPQPDCTVWSREQTIEWVRGRLDFMQPTGVVFANQRMQQDIGWAGPQTAIYHHHRPGIRINPIREKIQTIGYEGAPQFIEGWEAAIGEACADLGCAFTVNPRELADLDVVLALRGPRHNGYAQQHFKSNIKLANAHASGTPFIGMPEDGYEETRTGVEYWVKRPADLLPALRWLESQSAREQISERFLQAAYPVDKAATSLRAFLETLAR
jgi:hypothetical protein